MDDFRKRNGRGPDAFISTKMELLPENKNKKYCALTDPLQHKA